MNNRWNQEDESRERLAGWSDRGRAEPRRTYGSDQSQPYEEGRSFSPPRGAYFNEEGYGEASYQAGQPAVFGVRETGASYTGGYGARERADRHGQDFGYRPTYGEAYGRPDPYEGQIRAEGLRVEAEAFRRRLRSENEGRGYWDRMSDEAASWFGDSEARARRQADHRGKGPKGYLRSDTRINEDVHDCLTEDRHLDASGVMITVKDGEVTLNGVVPERHAKHHAEHLVEKIAGVTHVQNNLRVASGATPTDNSILAAQTAGKTGQG